MGFASLNPSCGLKEGTVMRNSTRACLAILAIMLDTDGAHAGAPPRQLYGKGVRIEYTAETIVAGERGTRNVVSQISRTIYVSTEGRLFERVVWSNREGTRVSDNTPGASTNKGGEARGMTFRGDILVAHVGYASGAGQMTVRFDPSFSSCQGEVVYGTEKGQTMSRRGVSGKMRQILSVNASNFRCSVTAGNPFP
jgi:hypothetical protein